MGKNSSSSVAESPVKINSNQIPPYKNKETAPAFSPSAYAPTSEKKEINDVLKKIIPVSGANSSHNHSTNPEEKSAYSPTGAYKSGKSKKRDPLSYPLKEDSSPFLLKEAFESPKGKNQDKIPQLLPEKNTKSMEKPFPVSVSEKRSPLPDVGNSGKVNRKSISHPEKKENTKKIPSTFTPENAENEMLSSSNGNLYKDADGSPEYTSFPIPQSFPLKKKHTKPLVNSTENSTENSMENSLGKVSENSPGNSFAKPLENSSENAKENSSEKTLIFSSSGNRIPQTQSPIKRHSVSALKNSHNGASHSGKELVNTPPLAEKKRSDSSVFPFSGKRERKMIPRNCLEIKEKSSTVSTLKKAVEPGRKNIPVKMESLHFPAEIKNDAGNGKKRGISERKLYSNSREEIKKTALREIEQKIKKKTHSSYSERLGQKNVFSAPYRDEMEKTSLFSKLTPVLSNAKEMEKKESEIDITSLKRLIRDILKKELPENIL